MTVNLHSMPHSLVKAFRGLPLPKSLTAFTGAFRAEYIGPAPLRVPAPLAMRLAGFGGWYGKIFRQRGGDSSVLAGMNLFGEGAQRSERYSMTARIAPSAIDKQPAFVVSYPKETRHPWCRATDELRMIDDSTLLGITFFDYQLVRLLPVPFLLRRETH